MQTKNLKENYRSGVSLTLNVGQAMPDGKPTLRENSGSPRNPTGRQTFRGGNLCNVGFTSDLQTTKQRFGFTLIELLVVVLIIGILAAVAVPQYQVAVERSRYAALKQVTRSIYEAEKVYFLANGEYTADFDTLSIDAGTNFSPQLQQIPRGSCALENGTEHIYVYCRDVKSKLGYMLYFKPYSNRQCIVYPGATSAANQVCKNETGLTTATTSTSAGSFYVYPD